MISLARLAARVARELARNAEVIEGRSMVCVDAGSNHWFHSDQVYRSCYWWHIRPRLASKRR